VAWRETPKHRRWVMIGLIGPALVIHELGKFVHHFGIFWVHGTSQISWWIICFPYWNGHKPLGSTRDNDLRKAAV
jgi:hypothetical protein